jgi:hypothetical protein
LVDNFIMKYKFEIDKTITKIQTLKNLTVSAFGLTYLHDTNPWPPKTNDKRNKNKNKTK